MCDTNNASSCEKTEEEIDEMLDGDEKKEKEIDKMLDGGAKTEEDEPIDKSFPSCIIAKKDLDTAKLDLAEKDKDRKERRYFSAFKLIVGCMIFLGIVYLIDVIMSAWIKDDLTKITNSVIEIIKTLLFTLSGYLFARKENGD